MKMGGANLIKHQLYRGRNAELNGLFIYMAVRSFSLSLISIYIPIYLYTTGFGMRGVLAYFFFLYLFESILQTPAIYLIKKYGSRVSLLLSTPVLVINLWMLSSIGKYHWPLWLVALSGASMLSLFWMAYHYDFVKAKTCFKTSREVGVLNIIVAIASALGPLLGGLVAFHLGFSVLFYIPLILLSLGSLVLLYKPRNRTYESDFDFKGVKLSKIKKDLTANFGTGWEAEVTAFYWPLFVFITIGSYQKVGAIITAGLISTILLTLWVAKKSDAGEKKRYIELGGYLSVILYVLQAFIQNVLHVFALDLANNFSRSIKTTPYTAEYYLRATETKPGVYIYLMELSVNIARFLLASFLFLLTFVLTDKGVLIVAFTFAAVGAILVMKMPLSKTDRAELKNQSIKLMPRPVRR